MRCSRCGEAIPANSQFCLRCGTPINSPPANSAGSPTVYPSGSPGAPSRTVTPGMGQAAPGGGGDPLRSGVFQAPGFPPSGPSATTSRTRGILIALILLLLLLVAATAAVVHHGASVTSGNGAEMHGAGLANEPAAPVPVGGLANANPAQLRGGGLANAPTSPGFGGGLATARVATPSGGGLANQPAVASPQTAQPMENVLPYLQALARIEAQRQQLNAQLSGEFGSAASQATGSQTVQDPQAALSAILAKEIQSLGNEDSGPDPLTKYMQQLTPAVARIASAHVQLLQEVDYLWTQPGVPNSCKDLQGYYRAAITPMVSLANAEQKNPFQFLQAAMTAQQEEGVRLNEAENALDQVFRSHQLQPFFRIKNTEDTGAGGLMSAPYIPGG